MNWEAIWTGIKGYFVLCSQYLANPWVWGAVLAAIALLAFLLWISRRQPARVRAFINDHGYVEIARLALVDVVRSACEKVDIEKRPGVAIRTRRGKLHVDVRIRLLCTRNLVEVSDILQRSLIDTLQQGMGIRKLGTINVIVTGIRTKSGKEARAELPLITSDREPEPPADETFELVPDGKKATEPSDLVVNKTEAIDLSDSKEAAQTDGDSDSTERTK
jgi:uncharacterized alkaline shock family protein YloU